MLGFHSIRPDIESGRPLRNTATAYSAPTLRARREAPSLASCSDHSLYLFQLAGALSTGQYKRAVSKQRQRPQTANRHEGIICPRGSEPGALGCSGLYTRHYRKVIAASVNLRASQLVAAASYSEADVSAFPEKVFSPAPTPSTTFRQAGGRQFFCFFSCQFDFAGVYYSLE